MYELIDDDFLLMESGFMDSVKSTVMTLIDKILEKIEYIKIRFNINSQNSATRNEIQDAYVKAQSYADNGYSLYSPIECKNVWVMAQIWEQRGNQIMQLLKNLMTKDYVDVYGITRDSRQLLDLTNTMYKELQKKASETVVFNSLDRYAVMLKDETSPRGAVRRVVTDANIKMNDLKIKYSFLEKKKNYPGQMEANPNFAIQLREIDKVITSVVHIVNIMVNTAVTEIYSANKKNLPLKRPVI